MNPHFEHQNQPARERALFIYTSALEQGDFDVVAQVLHQAEQDAQLERMIREVNEAYWIEEAQQVQANATAVVRQLLAEHLPSGMLVDEELPPLTTGVVVSRMEADETLTGSVRQELGAMAPRLRAAETVVPEDLSKRSVAGLFRNIGVSASQQLQKLFRETALLLSLGRQQGQSLGATRRQHMLGEQDEPLPRDEEEDAEC